MMRAPSFRWHAATSRADAARALAAGGPRALLLGGGTDVVPAIKRRQYVPELLISLRQVAELGRMEPHGASLRIGAGLHLATLAADDRLSVGHTALRRAAGVVASPHIRNVATLGGNLCLDTRCNYYDQTLEWRQAIDYCMKAPGPDGVARQRPDGGVCWVALSSPKCKAVSSTDGAPGLMVLGARVVLESVAGRRELPVEELYADDGMAYLTKRRDEILTAVRLPARTGWKSTYWKLRRRGSFDFPVLGVAAAVRLGKGGVVEEARVALGGVASRPVLLPAAAELVGRPLTDDAIAAFEHSAGKQARPLDNTDFDLHWRKRVARSFLRGVLQELRGDDMQAQGPLVRRATALIPVL